PQYKGLTEQGARELAASEGRYIVVKARDGVSLPGNMMETNRRVNVALREGVVAAAYIA
ncbi:MAG: hypothetical protein H7233_16435, partial [Pseudorhodobacter sp.]|nr:hypothetical protein [Frankiaceae bacterium]